MYKKQGGNMNNTLGKITLLMLFSLILNGCNNEPNNKQGLISQQAVQQYSKDTTLTGRVSNKKGNIRVGEIKASDNNNNFIASTQVEKNSHYALTIPANTKLPITLTYTSPEKDQDPMVSVVIYAALKKYDINDLTTLIAKKAKSLGGYTHSNMTIAADATVGVPDSNKTSTGFRGDPTKQYGGWH